eukprot:5714351-Pleurochrysis_carterae.AAC.3
MDVDTDADIARFVAKKEAKPLSGPGKARAGKFMVAQMSSVVSSFVTQVAKHLLQHAHHDMVCPEGEMPVTQYLCLMSHEDGICGPNQGTYSEAGQRLSQPHPDLRHRSDATWASRGLGKSF